MWENLQGTVTFRSAEARFACAPWHAREVETTGEGDLADPLGFEAEVDALATLDRQSRHAFENGLCDSNETPEGGADE